MKKIVIAASLLLAGCTVRSKADVGVSGGVHVPMDSAGKCTSLCGSLGLTLDSVVVMANEVGCVCRAAPAASPAAATGAASAGAATILLQRQAAAAAAAQRQQQPK